MTDAPEKKFVFGVAKAIANRQVSVIVSTATPDRYGDIVEVKGIDLTQYRANPVVLWMHKHASPIARCVAIAVVNGRLEATAQFPAEGEDEESDRIYRKIKSGIVNAVSIGFMPGEWSWIEDKGNKFGRRFITSEMLEWSFVGVPANAEALITQRGFKPEQIRSESLYLTTALRGVDKEHIDNEDEDAQPEEARRLLGATVRLDPAHPAVKDLAWATAIGKATGTVLASYVVDDGPKKGAHAVWVEFLSDKKGGFSGVLRGFPADAITVVKAGRVLSAANERSLRDAHEKIGAVLKQVEAQGDEPAADKKTLYVKRPVVNAAEIRAWAAKQGFKSALKAGDLHVTLAFSKTALDWSALTPATNQLAVSGGERSIMPLGDKGAVALRLESADLAKRWQEIRDAGASWDHDGYRPHVTITYAGKDLPIAEMAAYAGDIVLGAEVFAEVDTNWDSEIVEDALFPACEGCTTPEACAAAGACAQAQKQAKAAIDAEAEAAERRAAEIRDLELSLLTAA